MGTGAHKILHTVHGFFVKLEWGMKMFFLKEKGRLREQPFIKIFRLKVMNRAETPASNRYRELHPKKYFTEWLARKSVPHQK